MCGCIRSVVFMTLGLCCFSFRNTSSWWDSVMLCSGFPISSPSYWCISSSSVCCVGFYSSRQVSVCTQHVTALWRMRKLRLWAEWVSLLKSECAFLPAPLWEFKRWGLSGEGKETPMSGPSCALTSLCPSGLTPFTREVFHVFPHFCAFPLPHPFTCD